MATARAVGGTMKIAVIYGASKTGQRIYAEIKDKVQVVAYLDEDSKKWRKRQDGIEIYPPEYLLQLDYDFVYVGVQTYCQDVVDWLRGQQIPEEKIIDQYVSLPYRSRIVFLENARNLLDTEGVTEGAVAELGVYKGNFAKEINRVFSEHKLYLFDTFGGFAASDTASEKERGLSGGCQAGYFSDTSQEAVLRKMPHAEKCVVCPGFFPATAQGLENERFMFVNLDADLYEPTQAGLEWFFPRMVPGGIILVHDYYSSAFTGARQAVDEFAKTHKVGFLPIGDTLSVALRT